MDGTVDTDLVIFRIIPLENVLLEVATFKLFKHLIRALYYTNDFLTCKTVCALEINSLVVVFDFQNINFFST